MKFLLEGPIKRGNPRYFNFDGQVLKLSESFISISFDISWSVVAKMDCGFILIDFLARPMCIYVHARAKALVVDEEALPKIMRSSTKRR